MNQFNLEAEEKKVELVSLIDVIFLLLIFFLVTTAVGTGKGGSTHGISHSTIAKINPPSIHSNQIWENEPYLLVYFKRLEDGNATSTVVYITDPVFTQLTLNDCEEITQKGPASPCFSAANQILQEHKINNYHAGNLPLLMNRVLSILNTMSIQPPILPQGCGIRFGPYVPFSINHPPRLIILADSGVPSGIVIQAFNQLHRPGGAAGQWVLSNVSFIGKSR